ncbi:MAG TPA: hypothetical protein VML94_04320 [Thermoplasmata archaeon]|nr:hypothetical protein [Thermoplasmata archaeon]
MGLFSDVDWVIIVAVAAFLLFGRENAQVVRTLGRWYGRAVRLKQEMLSEVSKAADLPVGAVGAAGLRGALLGLDPAVSRASGIPAAVTTPPVAVASSPAFPEIPWTGGSPILSWSVTGVAPEAERFP